MIAPTQLSDRDRRVAEALARVLDLVARRDAERGVPANDTASTTPAPRAVGSRP